MLPCPFTCDTGISTPLAVKAQLALTYSQDFIPPCGTTDGAITLSASGGVPPYQYSLSGSPFGLLPTFPGIGAGAYLGRVLDANLDTAEVLVVLSNLGGPSLPFFLMQIPLVLGARWKYCCYWKWSRRGIEYSVDGVIYQPTGTFGGLGAGNYPVHVRNAAGCISIQVVLLEDPPAVELSLIGQTDVDCFGNNTGFFTVSGTGGTSGGFMYTLDGGTPQVSGTFSALIAGTYTASVVDLAGCVDLYQSPFKSHLY